MLIEFLTIFSIFFNIQINCFQQRCLNLTKFNPLKITATKFTSGGDMIYVSWTDQSNIIKISKFDISIGNQTKLISDYIQNNGADFIQNPLIYENLFNNVGGFTMTNRVFTRFYPNGTQQLPIGIVDSNSIQLFFQIIPSPKNNIIMKKTLVYSYPTAGVLLVALLSYDQKYLIISKQLDRISPAKFIYLNISSPNIQYVTSLGVMNQASIWLANKNQTHMYFLSQNTVNSQFKICQIHLLQTTYRCGLLNSGLDYKMVIFHTFQNKIVLYTKDLSYQSVGTQLVKIVVQFLDPDTFQVVKNISYTTSFVPTSNSFDEFNQKLVYTERDLNNINFHVLKFCNNTSYFDSCLNQCVLFHINCTSNTNEGCSCRYPQPTPTPTPPTPTPTPINYTVIDQNNWLQIIISWTLNNRIILFLNQIPGIRVISKQINYFLLNFDQIWLYNYHSRNYDKIISKTFKTVKIVQRQKWQAFNLNLIWEKILQEFHFINIFSNIKLSYSSYKYIKQENKSNQILANILNFIFPNQVGIILIYSFLYICKTLLEKHGILLQKLIEFALIGNFILLIFQGNIQFLSYLLFFQFKYLFTINFLQKIWSFFIIIIAFLLVFYVGSFYLMLIKFYNKKSKCFFQNFKNTKFGSLYLIISKNTRNLLLGFVHIFINDPYNLKIMILMFIELIFLFYQIIIIRQKKTFLFRLDLVWLNITNSLVRIILILRFYLFQDQQNLSLDSLNIVQKISTNLIILYILVSTLILIIQLLKLLYEIYKMNYSQFFNKISLIISSQKIKSVLLQKPKQKTIIKMQSQLGMLSLMQIKQSQVSSKQQQQIKQNQNYVVSIAVNFATAINFNQMKNQINLKQLNTKGKLFQSRALQKQLINRIKNIQKKMRKRLLPNITTE